MNQKKIGRNDPCPCGSGKKAKNCCGVASFPKFQRFPRAELGLLKTYFRNFDNKELFSILGGLQLVPENECHAVRLEIASNVACSIGQTKNENIDLEDFQEKINKFLSKFSDIGILEDPPEYLFTENIVFLGENYTVYVGNYYEENIILENFIEVLYGNIDLFPSDWISDIYSHTFAILWISDQIAHRLKHSRYMKCVNDYNFKIDDIFFPNGKEIFNFKNAVVFKKYDSNQPLPFDIQILKPFCAQISERSVKNLDLNKITLTIHPIIDLDNEIIILNPISLLCSLRHYVLKSIINNKLDKQFFELYINHLWKKSQEYLYMMYLDELDYSFPENSESLPIKEGLFNIDFDKVAYVQLICDNGDNYDFYDPKKEHNFDIIIEKIRERDIKILTKLKTEIPEIKDIFIMKILCDIGRTSIIKYQNIDNYRTLLITYENLRTLSHSGDCDQLTLWKFVKADIDASSYHEYYTFSFLDKFAFYLENNTLILETEGTPNVFLIGVGTGKKIRERVISTFDPHFAFIEIENLLSVLVKKRNSELNIPIYRMEYPVGEYMGYLIEGYEQPIWILYKYKQNLADFSSAISYWIWQFTSELKDYLQILGKRPIQIFFEVEDIENWNRYDRNYFIQKPQKCDFKYTIKNRDIFILIPKEITLHIQGINNSGDREIMRGFLLGIAELIKSESSIDILTDSKIEDLLNHFAPLGLKKQFFILLHKKEGLLIDNNLPDIRLIQEHDIQEQSLYLVDEIKKEISEQDLSVYSNSEICKTIVNIYMNRIKNLISKYNWIDLLKFFVSQIDSLLHTATRLSFIAPYQMASYPEDSEAILKQVSNSSKIDKTMLSMRILIEMIIIESPLGNQRISVEEIDKMVALTNNLYLAASSGDLYYYNILQENLIFGVGGRIHVPQLNLYSEKYSKFIHEVTEKNVEGSYDFFKGELDNQEEIIHSETGEFSTLLESALVAEFGLNSSDISNFFCCLIHSTELFICQDQDGPVYCLEYSEFVIRLKNNLGWSGNKIKSTINQFSMKKKDDGYNIYDEAPWKFRRDYSYARRPLLIGPDSNGNQVVIWGSLSSEKSIIYLQDLITEGRYDSSNSTDEMKKLISTIQNQKGDTFTDFVKDWFEKNSTTADWCIAKNVDLPILLDKIQKKDKELSIGDIDVLAINKRKYIIYSLECKNLNFARNSREVAQEIIRFYKGTKNDKSWILKHKKRDEWLKKNLDIVIEKYSLPLGQYQIKSLIISSKPLPSKFLYENDTGIPIISFSEIEENIIF